MAPRRRAGAARAALIATAALLALAGVRTTPADAAPRRADLVVTATTPGRLVAASGGAVNTKVSVRNRGRATAPRTLLALYLSRDARLGGGDRFLASGEVPALAPGRTAVRSMIAKLPTPLATGTWRVLACADANRSVLESSETNNCRVHRSFDVAAPAPPPSGPSGGAASVCGGSIVPYPQGTTPPPGVRFEVTPASPDGALAVTADPVGAEFEQIDQYAQTIVTVTNVGTTTSPGIAYQALSCVPARGAPGHWGSLDAWDDEIDADRRCGANGQFGAVLPGQSCDIALYASDVVRGGSNPGYLRLLAGDDVIAVFPVVVDALSRGYLALEALPGSDDLRNNAPGRHRQRLVKATNIGDRDAIPSFGFSDWAGVFEIDDTWTPPAGLRRCEVTYSGASGTYVGALSPGASCAVRVDVCSALPNVDYTTRLYASRIDGARQSDDLTLRYTTTAGPAEQAC